MASGSETAAKAARAALTAKNNPAANAVAMTAMKAVTATAGEDNKLSEPAVASSKPDLVANMTTAIAASPEFQHVSNSEPWWAKRSRWAAIIGVATVIGGPVLRQIGLDITPATQDLIVTSLTTVGGLLTSWLALRAGIAKKPLFSG